jgi:hypothetical protein
MHAWLKTTNAEPSNERKCLFNMAELD